MSEIIISKTCSQCKQAKPTSAFSRDRRSRDGRMSCCKSCKHIYRTSPKGRIIIRTYNALPCNVERRKQYLRTEKGIIAKQRIYARRKIQCPEKLRAKNAINNAVTAGKLPCIKSLFCSCSNRASHYHHYLGYAIEHHFDVIPMCPKCHKSIHILRLTA